MGNKARNDRRIADAEGAGVSGSGINPASAQPAGNKAGKAGYLAAGAIALVTFLIYLPSLQNGLLNWDDDKYVTNNWFIRHLDLNLLRSAFGFHEANWDPLTWVSHAVDYSIWGLNPLGHHLTSIALHAANSALVFFDTLRLIGLYRKRDQPAPWLDGRAALVAAAATGLLFGLHPIHVESVSWVAERKDVLCAMFYLLSLIAYVRYSAAAGASWYRNKSYLLCLGFFALALLSKPMAVSLPLVLLIIDWYPAGRIDSMRSLRAAITEKLPFILLSLGASVLTVMAQRAGGAMSLTEAVPLGSRLLVASNALLSYLWKMALPVGLLPFYPYPKSIPAWYPLSAAAVAAVFVAAAVMGRRHKALVSAFGYYAITLLPALGIVQVGGHEMADRFAYLPGIGPMMLLGLLAAFGWSKASALKGGGLSAKAVLLSAAALLAITLGYLTAQQEKLWNNDMTLWSAVVRHSPDSAKAHINLGVAYASEGAWDSAIQQYQSALRLDPDSAKAHTNLGVAYASKGLWDSAVAEYQSALRQNADSYESHYNLGVAYASKGLWDSAIQQYRMALQLNPYSDEAHNNLGVAYRSEGLWDRAISEYQEALRLRPDSHEAHNNLGIAYKSQGLWDKAISEYQSALRLDPGSYKTYNNIGSAYASQGLWDRAIPQYQAALRLNPDFFEAHFNLGAAYASKGLWDGAISEYQAALRLRPDSEEARQSLSDIVSRRR